MHAAQMQIGLVVVDDEANAPPSRRYFSVVECHDEELGPWVLEQVVGNKRRTLKLPEIERLRLPDDESGFEWLIGSMVRMTLTFGTTVTGVLEEVEAHTLVLDGDAVDVVTGFLVEGELYPVNQIEVLDAHE